MNRLSQKITPGLLLAQVYTDLKSTVRRMHTRGMYFTLLHILTGIAGVEVAIIGIRIVSEGSIIPSGVLLGCSLMSLLCIASIQLALRVNATHNLKEIDLADLLEREVVPLRSTEAWGVLKDRVILVTGAAGSIGSELCRQVLDYEPALLVALDSNETGLFDLAGSLLSHPCARHLLIHIDDITDVKRMSQLFEQQRPQIVFHAAAYKHVPLLERFPSQAVRTNALATYRLCCLAQKYAVERFVFVSTDKAAEPTSVMGMSKRIGEMVVQSLSSLTERGTCFCAVRFGNVLGSRGSVVPIFKQQIEQGGPVTVTHPDATRYFMTIPEACGLVILTAAIARRGGLYLLDMGRPVRILDLAKKMIRQYGLREGKDIEIIYTGLRPGEHVHETLAGAQETLTPTSHGKIFCVGPGDNTPEFAALAQWLDYIEHTLPLLSGTEVRKLLNEMIWKQEKLYSIL